MAIAMYNHPDISFNSRPCERGDTVSAKAKAVSAEVSIHAPARGATQLKALKAFMEEVSIHAPARGATF